MIEEFAVVVEKKAHQAVLELERRTACGLCGQKRGCGNATWGKLLGHQTQKLQADNVINANVGDSVVIGIDEHPLLKAVFCLYVVPLLGLIIGALLADTLFNNEFYVMLGAALGLILAFISVKIYLNYAINRSHTAYQATILRHADETSTCENQQNKYEK